MNAQSVVEELRLLGRESYKKILLRHGAVEPCFGVKIEDLKKIQKRIKKDHAIAKDLFDTGIYDAQYLAGLIADDAQMTAADLDRWLDRSCRPLACVTVANVAAGSPEGWASAMFWIDSADENRAAAGWATLSALVSVTPDTDLDIAVLEKLLHRVGSSIATVPNFVRYQMNGFLIAAGCFVPALTATAKKVAKQMGRISVDMGETSCEVPEALEYIEKVEKRGSIGKKRKSAKC